MLKTRGVWCILLAQLFAFRWQGAAVAVSPDAGQTLTGWIQLLGKRIPLPQGEWRIASGGFGQVTGSDPGPYGTIGGVLLVRPTATSAHEFLLIHTNALPVRDGWGEPAECADATLPFQSVAETRDRKNACSFVMPVRIHQLLRARLPALADVAEAKSALPGWALIAGLRVSDRADMVDMTYGVAPDRPDPAGWFDDDADGESARRALVKRLADWSLRARPVVLAGLRDPSRQTPPMPPFPLTTGVTGTPPPQDITVLQLAMYKLASIQLFEMALTFSLATGVSADPYIGALQMFWQGWTHSALYVGNEVVWERQGTPPVMRFAASTPSAAGPASFFSVGAVSPVALATRDTRLALPSAAAADASQDGDVMPGAPFASQDKQIPLPFGHWRVLSRSTDEKNVGTVLGRIEDNSLVGVVIVYANAERRDAIFGTSGDCGRSDIAFAAVRYDTPDDGYCVYGKKLALDRAGTRYPLWQAALKRLNDDGVRLPETLLMVGARARTRENFLDVRYGFSELQANGDDDPITAMQAWSELLQQPLELGVRGRLPAGGANLPWPWQTAAVADAAIQQIHGPLEALATTGAIDDATLVHQVALSDEALATPEQQRWSLWVRAAYKTAGYRIASIADTFGVAWLVTGSVAQTLAYGAANQIVRPLIIYINEIAWAHSSIGKAPASLLPVTFPEIGSDLR